MTKWSKYNNKIYTLCLMRIIVLLTYRLYIQMGNENSRRKRMDSWSHVQEKAVSPIKKGFLLK
jgi:hypothetical protein